MLRISFRHPSSVHASLRCAAGPAVLAVVLAVAVVAAGFGAAAKEGAAKAAPDADPGTLRERARGLFEPVPEKATTPDNPITPAKVELGRMLYYDERLSKSQEISCNTCHLLDEYGVDHEPTSIGHGGERGERNAPTVYNAALHISQFWDGRAADVEEQAKGPVLNPIEMGMPSPDYVLRVLRSIPGYAPLFAKAFPDEEDPIDYDNVAKAIGAFERQLMTPAPFDAFLEGDDDALSGAQLAGFETYLRAGCTTCHRGVAVGGGMYMKLGLVKPYPVEDVGRYAVTGEEADQHVFKVPSLRNVTQTGPWFHDGSIGSLDEAVRLMAEHQIGKDLTDAEVASILAFLGSLTGEIPGDYIARPELPESGPETPAPDPS